MCGIIGIFGNNNPKERAIMSLEKITHRGSDVFELEFFENGSLGANRLAIVDRKNGKQPKSNEDETIFVAQNGEIFNYKNLKKNLEDKGHRFKTDSDTEVLAHLYEEYGEKMIDMLDSEMFAFIIYNRKNGDIFVVRDPLGVKPLYYAYDKSGQIYFASEIKQLSIFNDIDEIRVFPPGSYYFNGKINPYFSLESSDKLKDEDKTVRMLEEKIVKAVAKRVDTDLPIGVLLSGGVDSSLMMEIASRFHPDVTAIILGFKGSPDYDFAMRLCKKRKYKYCVVTPDADYAKDIDAVVYHVETFEPNIIRHSFAVDMCAKKAKELGLKIVLVGEGSDELFCGYNEFSNLSGKFINKGSKYLVENLHSGQLQRVDRMSMKHTIEARVPLLDREVVDMAMQISGELKVKRENHQVTTKYILRKVASNFLPDYIAWRYKVPFSNGAGMNVGNNFKSQDREVAKAVLSKKIPQLEKSILKKFKISTDEEKYYLGKFIKSGFDKLRDAQKRIITKEKLNELSKSEKTKLLVAEFGRLALYFPVYLAKEKRFFDKRGLDVDFIATGGDDKTFDSLVNSAAHIGLSDPMFAMFENKTGVKGEILGEIVSGCPNVAIAINPNIRIGKMSDFTKYKVGTFQKFSTTHTVTKFLLPEKAEIIPMEKEELFQRLVDRTIDIAIVIPEYADAFLGRGGRIIFNFKDILPNILNSGFTIANVLEDRYRREASNFMDSVREAMRFIGDEKNESVDIFRRLFPEIIDPEVVFNAYLTMWVKDLKVIEKDYKKSQKIWKNIYPEILKKYYPYFIK